MNNNKVSESLGRTDKKVITIPVVIGAQGCCKKHGVIFPLLDSDLELEPL